MHTNQSKQPPFITALNYPLDARQVYSALRSLGDAIILDSCRDNNQYGRFDIITAAPVRKVKRSPTGTYHMLQNKTWIASTDDFFSIAQAWLKEFAVSSPCINLPFSGGLMGYLSYDAGRYLETLPVSAAHDIIIPDALLGLYLTAVIIDHDEQKSYLVHHPQALADTYLQFLSRLDFAQLNSTISEPSTQTHQHKHQQDARPFMLSSAFTSNFTQESYQETINSIHEYILSGDCYQINLAQRFTATCSGDSWHAWQALRQAAPTPYAAYMEVDKSAILSLSPERFLQVNEHGLVETKPIKGTRPRGHDFETDQHFAEALCNSEKDRAENLMIVDLMRNDLSKVCRPESVHVTSLFALESYVNVHHLVSTITGELDSAYTPIDLMTACFPGGSITGAPKIRAMEIIEKLEPHRRSVYCGSIAYFSSCGRMDSSIAIRTLVQHANQIHCWGGGGIVADSQSLDEYQETFSKVTNLLSTLERLYLHA